MSLQVIGLSHRTAPVALRERLAFTAPGHLPRALAALQTALAPTECVLLSTCNRTELYLYGETLTRGQVAALLGQLHGDAPVQAEHFDERRGHRAAEHLFRVAAGLESMILGEYDIVRQVKDAYAAAGAAGTTGPALNALFHEALRVAKKARTELDLSRGAFSVGHAAAELAESIFGSLHGRTVLILGAGEMSETTARHLTTAGATSVVVASRTFDRAAHLAETLGGRAIPFESFPENLARADIVVAATSAPHTIVHRELVASALQHRRHRPLFLIDIALPRDIDHAVGSLDDVYLYDLDDLQQLVDAESAERRKRAGKAEELIAQEALAFTRRHRANQTAAPLVSSVRAKHRALADSELERLRRRLPHLSGDDWTAIEASLETLLSRIAHDPTAKIKELAASESEDDIAKLALVRELYGLEPTE